MLLRPTLTADVAPAVTFVGPLAADVGERYGLRHEVAVVRDTRGTTKADMVLNDACPRIDIDPETFRIAIDGEEVEPDPATDLPLAQRYSLF